MFVEFPHFSQFLLTDGINSKLIRFISRTAGQMRSTAMNANGNCPIFLSK